MTEPTHLHQGLHCTDCGVIFESINSLQVHIQYHKENLLMKWGTPFPQISPPSPSMTSLQSQSFQPFSSVQHGKSVETYNASAKYAPVQNLNEHSLSPLPLRGYGEFSNGYRNRLKIDGEPQAEILDLDSHKVHVYQPPEGEKSETEDSHSHSMSPMMSPWHVNKKYYPENTQDSSQHSNSTIQTPLQQQQQQQQQVPATPLNLPLPHTLPSMISQHNGAAKISSPDFTMASSSSLTPPAESQVSLPQQAYPPTKSSKSGGSWKSNEARRPKTYNCTACNKWFTSSGHLKRHYNTTLHRNAVKQSGVPDPATLPISTHHHPQKDPNFSSKQQQQQIQQQQHNQQQQQQQQQQPDTTHHHTGKDSILGNNNNNCIRDSPNFLAGPSETSRGLLSQQQLSTQFPPTPHQSYLPFTTAHPYQESMTVTHYPNFLPPHVSFTRQVITNSIIGNLVHIDNHCSVKINHHEYVGGLCGSQDLVCPSPESSLKIPFPQILFILLSALYVLLMNRTVSFLQIGNLKAVSFYM